MAASATSPARSRPRDLGAGVLLWGTRDTDSTLVWGTACPRLPRLLPELALPKALSQGPLRQSTYVFKNGASLSFQSPKCVTFSLGPPRQPRDPRYLPNSSPNSISTSSPTLQSRPCTPSHPRALGSRPEPSPFRIAGASDSSLLLPVIMHRDCVYTQNPICLFTPGSYF